MATETTVDLAEISPESNPVVDVSVLSQWALIKARFQKHRLAVIALYLISLLYFLALFAGFFAPYSQFRRSAAYSYAPPQVPRFSLQDGLYVHALKSQTGADDRDPHKKIDRNLFGGGK